MWYSLFQKKYYLPIHYFIAVTTLLLCISVSLFFIYHEISLQNSLNTTIIRKLAPLPTAINPNFINQVNSCFIPTAAVYGYKLRITDGFRSVQEQTQLYNQGRTVNGHIVTEAPAGRSIHNYGYAVDIVDRVRGYNINWIRLVKIAAYCGLESSGSGDWPHFEHRAGLSTDDFMYGMRPPLLTLPCSVMATNKKLSRKDLQSCGAPNF